MACQAINTVLAFEQVTNGIAKFATFTGLHTCGPAVQLRVDQGMNSYIIHLITFNVFFMVQNSANLFPLFFKGKLSSSKFR